jgi:ABC-type transport system involved in multi-copper enzyme maturation permease subunit
MTWSRLVRAELRKLTSTRLPWAFLAVLVAISAITAVAVVWGTDMDGSKAFIATAEDQKSLVAFAANAMMIAGLFGAIAVAREYGHGTVVPMFLTEPRRNQAVLAQFGAVLVGGGVLGLVGAVLSVAAVALSLPATEFGFLVPAGGVAQVIAASSFAGAAGALLGAGIGASVRNTGGAVAGAVLALVIAPPLVVQLATEAASWVPNTLNTVVSGVTDEVGVLAALAALAAWAIVPAAIGLVAVQRRDVV